MESEQHTLEVGKIHQGDCMELMKRIPDGSVDMILCDLPYGVTNHPADNPLPMNDLWIQYKRIIKKSGCIVLTSQFPFTVDLINAARDWFKYDLVWDKVLVTGFLNANRRPLRVHEQMLVFAPGKTTYNPQKVRGKQNHSIGKATEHNQNNYGVCRRVDNKEKLGDMKHPTSIITIQKTHASKTRHRTEKPVELAEWLIKSFTNEHELVLDNCIGTGWTALACKKHNRKFIGIEQNKEFVMIAEERIRQETLIV